MPLFKAFGCILAVAAAMAASSATAASYAQKHCKGPVTGVGVHTYEYIAVTKARADWSTKVKALYGPVWTDPGQMKVHAASCMPHRGPKPGQNHWACQFIASPCKVVNNQLSPFAPGVKPRVGLPGTSLRKR